MQATTTKHSREESPSCASCKLRPLRHCFRVFCGPLSGGPRPHAVRHREYRSFLYASEDPPRGKSMTRFRWLAELTREPFGLKGEGEITVRRPSASSLRWFLERLLYCESDDNRILAVRRPSTRRNTNFGTPTFGPPHAAHRFPTWVLPASWREVLRDSATAGASSMATNAVFGEVARFDNVINYSTPLGTALVCILQYSGAFDMKSEKPDGGVKNADPPTAYGAIGARLHEGAFSTIGVVDTYHFANTQDDAGYTANLSVADDFNVAEGVLAGQVTSRICVTSARTRLNEHGFRAAVFGNSTAKTAGANQPRRDGPFFPPLSFFPPDFGGEVSTAAVGLHGRRSFRRTAGKLMRYTVSPRLRLFALPAGPSSTRRWLHERQV